jgi:hypothetical protein
MSDSFSLHHRDEFSRSLISFISGRSAVFSFVYASGKTVLILNLSNTVAAVITRLNCCFILSSMKHRDCRNEFSALLAFRLAAVGASFLFGGGSGFLLRCLSALAVALWDRMLCPKRDDRAISEWVESEK